MLAQAAGDASTRGWDYLLQLGVLGLFVAAVLTGLIWVKPAVDRILKENEELKATNAKMLAMIQEQALPALADATKLVPAMTEMASQFSQLREEIRRAA